MLQGLAGGGLQPSSQGILLDAFPPEKQGAARPSSASRRCSRRSSGRRSAATSRITMAGAGSFTSISGGAARLLVCRAVVLDPAYLGNRAGKMRRQKRTLRYARPGAVEHDDDLLGNAAEQRTGMGLVGRSVRAGAGTADFVSWPAAGLIFGKCGSPIRSSIFGTLADRNFRSPASSFSARSACSTPTPRLSRPAAIALRLRCHHLGLVFSPGGRVRRHCALDRRHAARARRRCAVSHGRGLLTWRRQLLDVANESRHHSRGKLSGRASLSSPACR